MQIVDDPPLYHWVLFHRQEWSPLGLISQGAQMLLDHKKGGVFHDFLGACKRTGMHDLEVELRKPKILGGIKDPEGEVQRTITEVSGSSGTEGEVGLRFSWEELSMLLR